jgi:hypothetical protein
MICAIVTRGASAESYFSATGTFSAESSTADFFFNVTEPASNFVEHRTFAHDGGTNNAGDVIPSGGIDSYLELYNSSSLIASNDDRQSGKFDSLIGRVLGPGSYRLRMETTPFGGGLYNGAWAADIWRDGNFTLSNITGAGSTIASLKIASTDPSGMIVSTSGGLNMTGLLEVRSGAVLKVQTSPLRVGSLAITGTGKIDLQANNMIVDYTGATPAAAVRNLLHSGAIVSTGLAPGRILGVGEASTLGITMYEGQTVDSTTLVTKSTFGGDANMDGKVDVTDLGALATNWQMAGEWMAGDFNYDGFIDVTDLGLLATNWQSGVGAGAGSPLSAASFDEALASVGLGGVAVPEPTTLLGFACVAALSRKRRISAR